ncbi:MAG: cytochrome c biogenesis protein CcsA [Gammaproteobacteria bacterium]|nr:cytochrome c biogenesis protein CcsA [Gammaproteobacteria bacterium]MDH5594490.1 cytochrome c biogenesis protein CcsA [Gammaproteobacteria bacterium]MDH5614355.1 cytochrome c biogenesis protein CcsA [Gammaproteobacteria bacterium]
MEINILSILACILYLIGGFMASKQLQKSQQTRSFKSACVVFTLIALTLHGVALSQVIFNEQGINLGFFNAISFAAWCVVALFLIASLFKPVTNLGIAILPIAGIAVLLGINFDSTHLLPAGMAPGIKVHIVFSIMAYSLLSIAALQALLLSIQDHHLHAHHPGGFIRNLPPLETMEKLLFQMITAGFVLLSISLLSGVFFLEDIFAQHLVHKTALSIFAWVVFGTLLWGRTIFGWRGRVAIRWTLTGFVVLLLAYFGSKLVLELILNR